MLRQTSLCHPLQKVYLLLPTEVRRISPEMATLQQNISIAYLVHRFARSPWGSHFAHW